MSYTGWTPLPWLAAFNQTPEQFNALVTVLRKTGFRPISLCMHGDSIPLQLPETTRFYSSIWVNRPGPKWDIAQYLLGPTPLEKYLADQRQKGFFPRLVGAIQNIGADGFAVVTEEGAPESTLEFGAFGFELDLGHEPPLGVLPSHRRALEFPRWCAAYGHNVTQTGSLCRYAFVWEKQPDKGRVLWNAFSNRDHFDSNSSWYGVHDAGFALAKGFWRPDLCCINPGGPGFLNQQVVNFGPRYLSIWRDDHLNAWSNHVAITEAELVALFQNLDSFRFPIRLQAGGAPGPNQRFSVMFAASDEIIPRTFQIQHVLPPVNPQNPVVQVSPFGPVDAWVQDQIETNGIRAAQLAITFKGRLVHAAAFTNAEFGYPQTTNTNLFRTGSISKAITAFGVAHAWDRGKLHPFKDTIDTLLSPDPTTADWRFGNRKLIHFLSHTSKLIPQVAQTFLDPLTIATYYQKTQMTDEDLVRFIVKDCVPAGAVGQDMWFTEDLPPNNAFYDPPPGPFASLPVSNYNGAGFFIAGQCLARRWVTSTYFQAMKDAPGSFFDTLQMKRPTFHATNSGAAVEAGPSDEVRAHDIPGYNHDLQNLTLVNGQVVPVQAGPWTYEAILTWGGAAGSWVMSAADVARIFSLWDVPDNPLFSQQELIEDVIQYQYGQYVAMGPFTDYYSADPTIAPAKLSHNGAIPGGRAVVYRRYRASPVAQKGEAPQAREAIVIVLLWNGPRSDGTGLGDDEGYMLYSLATAAGDAAGWPTWNLFSVPELELQGYGL